MSNNISIKIISEPEKSVWQNYILSKNEATFCHSWHWRKILEETYGHQSFYLMAYEGEKPCGALALCHIKSVLFGNLLVSSPFATESGLLADSESSANSLLERAFALADELKTDFLKIADCYHSYEQMVQEDGFVTFKLDLDEGYDTIFMKKFDSKCRNQIRKSRKENFEAFFGKTELIQDSMRVMHENMRDLGSPFHNEQLYEKIFEYFNDDAELCVIKAADKPIGTCLLINSGSTVFNLHASTLRAYNNSCANNFLYDRIIHRSCEKKMHCFDFGRSFKDSGTARFKKQWGGEEIPVHHNYYLGQADEIPKIDYNNPKYALAIMIWKRLPVFITRAIGHRIVRFIP